MTCSFVALHLMILIFAQLVFTDCSRCRLLVSLKRRIKRLLIPQDCNCHCLINAKQWDLGCLGCLIPDIPNLTAFSLFLPNWETAKRIFEKPELRNCSIKDVAFHYKTSFATGAVITSRNHLRNYRVQTIRRRRHYEQGKGRSRSSQPSTLNMRQLLIWLLEEKNRWGRNSLDGQEVGNTHALCKDALFQLTTTMTLTTRLTETWQQQARTLQATLVRNYDSLTHSLTFRC